MYGHDNEFITLTYDNDHLPDDLSLQKEDFQNFMKRFRKHFSYTGVHDVVDPKTGKISRPIRYYHCGEYGDRFARPHYHACLFNIRLPDRKPFKVINGVPLFTSDILRKIWGKGHVSTGNVTFESAAYVARYMTKKVKGKNADAHYGESYDLETGEVFLARQPEYCTMSLKPGLGRTFYEKYKDDIYTLDKCIIRGGIKCSPPRYYDNLYKAENPDHWREIEEKRVANMEKHAENNSQARLKTRERVLLRRIENLKRTFETGETK